MILKENLVTDPPTPAMVSTLLGQVVRAAPRLIAVFDPAFRSVFINDHGHQLMGPTADRDPLSLFDLFRPDEREAIRDAALPILLRDGYWEGEYGCHFPGGDGDGASVKWDLFLLRTPAGEMVGTACLATSLTQRLSVERRLRESRARLKAASDLAGLSSYQWDPRSGALLWEDGLKILWGLPPGVEPSLALWEQGVHPDDREWVKAAADQAVDPAGEGVCDIQYRVVGLHGGPERWVRTFGETRFEHGEAAAFTGAVLDITDQKRAEAQLRGSEARFRRFAENTHEILWILNSGERRLEYLSPGFQRAAGVPVEAAMVDIRVWEGCIHLEDRAVWTRNLERVADEGESIIHEYRLVRPDGSVRRIRDRAFPIRDAEGRVVQIGGIAHDVSGRAPLCVYIVDPRPPVREARAAALRDAGHQVTTFATESGFLDTAPALGAGCVLVRTDDSSPARFSLAPALRARRADLPVIFEADLAGDVDLAILAMKSGATDILQTPADPDMVLLAVASALATVRESGLDERAAQAARGHIALMSRREREVLEGLLRGGTNKTMARDLGISPRTVEIYRARVMERLGAHTVPQAVLAAAAAGLKPERG